MVIIRVTVVVIALTAITTVGLTGLAIGQTPVLTRPNKASDHDPLFNAAGYRKKRYRAPTRKPSPSGLSLDVPGLQALMRQERPLLLDVQAIMVRPETAEFGISWLPSEVRYHIPGSLWLPNIGYAELSVRMHSYMQNALLTATGNDDNTAIVVYCIVDCWLSWNTVKRLSAMGYRRVYWYPGGTDDWVAAGLPTVVGEPLPLDDD